MRPRDAAGGRRARLVAALAAAGREQSTAAVLFHGAMADRFGLSATDNKALELLARLGPLTAGQLAEHTGLASASVTALVDRLEAKGLVRRRRDHTDRRRVLVEPVPEGVARIAEAFARFGLQGEELWAGYSVEQLELLHDFLLRSAALLRAATARLGEAADGPGG